MAMCTKQGEEMGKYQSSLSSHSCTISTFRLQEPTPLYVQAPGIKMYCSVSMLRGLLWEICVSFTSGSIYGV